MAKEKVVELNRQDRMDGMPLMDRIKVRIKQEGGHLAPLLTELVQAIEELGGKSPEKKTVDASSGAPATQSTTTTPARKVEKPKVEKPEKEKPAKKEKASKKPKAEKPEGE